MLEILPCILMADKLMFITYTVATIWLAAATYQNRKSINDIIKELEDQETFDKEKLKKKKRYG